MTRPTRREVCLAVVVAVSNILCELGKTANFHSSTTDNAGTARLGNEEALVFIIARATTPETMRTAWARGIIRLTLRLLEVHVPSASRPTWLRSVRQVHDRLVPLDRGKQHIVLEQIEAGELGRENANVVRLIKQTFLFALCTSRDGVRTLLDPELTPGRYLPTYIGRTMRSSYVGKAPRIIGALLSYRGV